MKNNKKALKSAPTGAAIFAACGFLFLAKSFHAKITNITVPAGVPGGPAFLTPTEGFIVAFLFFAVAGYALLLAYRARKKSDD
jgi:hypothetical protein